MGLRLQRTWLTDRSTIGELSIDGAFECFTLEDVVREPGVKVPGQTAIPAGRYSIVVTPSQRFHEDLPLLLDVPGFEGIRIHAGNTDRDTEGCILVGRTRSTDFIGESRAALATFLPKLHQGLGAGPCIIVIEAA